MTFPNELSGVCDHADAKWPKNWFKNFGSGTFFHVSGLREYVCEAHGPESPSVVAEWLIEHKDEIYFESEQEFRSLITIDWLEDIYGSDQQDIDYKFCLITDNFTNLTVANVRDAYSGKPTTFAASLLVYMAAILFIKRKNINYFNDLNILQIRFAGYYISNFSTMFPKMTDAQKIELTEHTGQVLPGNNLVFNQMADGRPVTKPLADRAAAFVQNLNIENGNLIPPLKVRPYQLRTDIKGGIKKSATAERTYLTFENLD